MPCFGVQIVAAMSASTRYSWICLLDVEGITELKNRLSVEDRCSAIEQKNGLLHSSRSTTPRRSQKANRSDRGQATEWRSQAASI